MEISQSFHEFFGGVTEDIPKIPLSNPMPNAKKKKA